MKFFQGRYFLVISVTVKNSGNLLALPKAHLAKRLLIENSIYWLGILLVLNRFDKSPSMTEQHLTLLRR